MVQVAERAPVLAGAALARVKAVEAAFGGNDGADEQAIREEFASLMAVA